MKPSYEELETEVIKLRSEIVELRSHILRLEEFFKKNSQNSSKPPSSDQKANSPLKDPKKRGPLFGHTAHQRALFPEDLVKERIVVKEQLCKQCGGAVKVLEDPPLIHQQVEIPQSNFYVRQMERHYFYCPCCKKKGAASFPPNENKTGFGPRLTSFLALCTGQYRLSKDQARALIKEAFGVPISAGSVINLERRISHALLPSYSYILQNLQGRKDVKHLDETSWRTEGKNRYLWLLATSNAVVYKIQKGRGGAELQELLNAQKNGIFITDRYAVYRFTKHQLCLAHLLRDLQKYKERAGPDGSWGHLMKELLNSVLSLWHDFRLGELSRGRLIKKSQFDRDLFRYWLTKGVVSKKYSSSLQRFAFSLHRNGSSFFRFIYNHKVDPTNNHAERLLRPAVIWRKTSFGSRSPHGERFIERICSVLNTLALQGKQRYAFLQEAIYAYLHHFPIPVLGLNFSTP